MPPLVLDFATLRMSDVASVGGKNASLGEMIGGLAQAGVRVPGGYATTAQATTRNPTRIRNAGSANDVTGRAVVFTLNWNAYK